MTGMEASSEAGWGGSMAGTFALVGKAVLPGGLLRRAGVVVEGGVISSAIEAPHGGYLPNDGREVSAWSA